VRWTIIGLLSLHGDCHARSNLSVALALPEFIKQFGFRFSIAERSTPASSGLAPRSDPAGWVVDRYN
jgi:hypothetical protein